MPGALDSAISSPAHHKAPLSDASEKEGLGNANPATSSSFDWNTVASTLPVGLLVFDASGNLLFENDRITALTGYPIREKGGIEPWLASLCPDDSHRDQVIDSWRSHIWRNQLTRTFSLKGDHQKLRELEFRSSLLENGGIAVIVQDVTDSVRAEETQRHSQLKFRSLFRETIHPSVLVDRTDRIIDANPAFLNLVGIPLGELRMSALSELLHPSDASEVADEICRLQDEKHPHPTAPRMISLRCHEEEARAELIYCPIGESGRPAPMGLYLLQPEATSLRDEKISAVTDEKRKLREQLISVSMKAQALLDAVPDLILLLDGSLTLIDFAPPPEPWPDLDCSESWNGKPIASSWPVLGTFLATNRQAIHDEGKTVRAELQLTGESGHRYSITATSVDKDQSLVIVRQKSEKTVSPERDPDSSALLSRPKGQISRDSLFEGIPHAILVVDPETRILDLNKAAANLFEDCTENLKDTLFSEQLQPEPHPEGKIDRHFGRIRTRTPELLVEIETFALPEAAGPGELGILLTPWQESQPRSQNATEELASAGSQSSPSSNPSTLERELAQHRFRNQIQLVTSLFSLEPLGAAARNAFLKWHIRLRSIAHAVPAESESIPITEMIEAVADDVALITGSGPGHRAVEVTGDDLSQIDAERSSPLALIAGELMRLVLEHRQEGDGPGLFFKLKKSGMGDLILRVRPGAGRRFLFNDEDTETEILEILAAQMGGHLECSFDSHGQVWTMTFPAKSGEKTE
ncbi:MAG: PAS domain-containing protein [Verrucomicrobiota bacterium]